MSLNLPNIDNLNNTKQVIDLGYAISIAEGFGADPNNVPTRAHNPGDLKIPNWKGPVTGSEGITVFPNDTVGWNHLYDQLNRIRNNRSHVYLKSMTFAQFARVWTDTAQSSWLNNILEELKKLGYTINESTTLQDFFSSKEM